MNKEERKHKILLLKKAIEAGEESGYLEDFDPVKHLEELNAKCSECNGNASQIQKGHSQEA